MQSDDTGAFEAAKEHFERLAEIEEFLGHSATGGAWARVEVYDGEENILGWYTLTPAELAKVRRAMKAEKAEITKTLEAL